MAARAGMENVIQKTRLESNAGTADYSVAGETYWTDEQVQEQLDLCRTTIKNLSLVASPDNDGGTAVYFEYLIPGGLKNFEEDGADSGWAVQNSIGGTAAHTVNYEAGVITFAADTLGTAYFLDARTYDINRAAANIWEQKAGFVSNRVDWSSDNHRFAASKEAEAYMVQAKRLRSLSGIQVSFRRRVDEN